MPASANLEIFDCARLAETAAEDLHIADQLIIPHLFRARHQLGERPPYELLLGPALDWLESRHDSGFGRECCQHRLGEAVDRLDLEATRTIKNLGKKLPGALSRSGIIGFAERQQVRRELAVLQPHPFGEASSDTVRHFGRGSLREGQAEDRFRAR